MREEDPHLREDDEKRRGDDERNRGNDERNRGNDAWKGDPRSSRGVAGRSLSARRGGSDPSAGSGTFVTGTGDGSEGDSSPTIKSISYSFRALFLQFHTCGA